MLGFAVCTNRSRLVSLTFVSQQLKIIVCAWKKRKNNTKNHEFQVTFLYCDLIYISSQHMSTNVNTGLTNSFMKEIKVWIRASYMVFLCVKTENNNFLKEIKHVICAIIAWWKSRQSLWEFSSRRKSSTASRVFHDPLSNSPKLSSRILLGCEGTENMFYFSAFLKAVLQTKRSSGRCSLLHIANLCSVSDRL